MRREFGVVAAWAVLAGPLTAQPAVPAADGCGPTGVLCDPCPPACGPDGRCWVSGEWFFGVVQGNPLPPLVTTSPAGTGRANAGVLGTPGAATLFGGRRVNDDFRSGLRAAAGYWLDDARTRGVEGSFFFLGDSRQGFAAGSGGLPILSRPFTSTAGGPASELVALPGVLAGGVAVDAYNRVVGGDVVFRRNLCCGCDGRLDLLLGYRYLGLTDDLAVTESLTAADPAGAVPVGTRIVVRDRFRTETDFHGGVIGLAGERRFGRLYLDGRASVALGNSQRVVQVSGSTTVTTPDGATAVQPGGLLAQRTNSGRFVDDGFAVVPEAGLRVGYQAAAGVRVFAGYNYLLLSRVARAGDQIDRTVNPTGIPPGTLVGPARPAVRGDDTTVWVQGVSVGLELRY